MIQHHDIILRQVETIAGRRHAHVVELLYYCEEEGERVLVYEFMDKGSLRCLLQRQREGTRSIFDTKFDAELDTKIRFGIGCNSPSNICSKFDSIFDLLETRIFSVLPMNFLPSL